MKFNNNNLELILTKFQNNELKKQYRAAITQKYLPEDDLTRSNML
jgi:hypothetical protein